MIGCFVYYALKCAKILAGRHQKKKEEGKSCKLQKSHYLTIKVCQYCIILSYLILSYIHFLPRNTESEFFYLYHARFFGAKSDTDFKKMREIGSHITFLFTLYRSTITKMAGLLCFWLMCTYV